MCGVIVVDEYNRLLQIGKRPRQEHRHFRVGFVVTSHPEDFVRDVVAKGPWVVGEGVFARLGRGFDRWRSCGGGGDCWSILGRERWGEMSHL